MTIETEWTNNKTGFVIGTSVCRMCGEDCQMTYEGWCILCNYIYEEHLEQKKVK